MKNSLLKTSILATILVGGFSASAIYALNAQQSNDEYATIAPISDNGFTSGIDDIGINVGDGVIIGSGDYFYTLGYTSLIYDQHSYDNFYHTTEPRKYKASQFFWWRLCKIYWNG